MYCLRARVPLHPVPECRDSKVLAVITRHLLMNEMRVLMRLQ
jgi:hypothetical protein